MSTVQGETRRIELPGGQVLQVTRFDARNGRTALSIAKGWPEQMDPTGTGGEAALPLPGDVAGELVEALEELFPEAGS